MWRRKRERSAASIALLGPVRLLGSLFILCLEIQVILHHQFFQPLLQTSASQQFFFLQHTHTTMPDSRRPRRSRHYDDYSDSDDDYSSDDARRHRDRDDRRREPQRHRSTRDRDGRNDRSYENYDRRRPRSVDDRHHSSRNDRYSSRERDRDYGRDHDRSRAPEDASRNSQLKIQNAVNAGLKAGALEAFRLRKEPGPWVGSKGVRIATAVFGAAMADTALEKGRDPERNRKTNSAKATLSGLVLNRFLNGPRDKVGRR